MASRRTLALPAVPLVGALVLGVALAEGAGAGKAWWGTLALVGAILAAGLRSRSPGGARILLLGAAIACGGWRIAPDLDRGASELGARLGQGPLEAHLVGRVLAAPESDREGQRVLQIAGRIGGGGGCRGRKIVVRLRVRHSPPDASDRVDRLRHGDRVRVWCRLKVPRRRGNPGSSDPIRQLRARGLDAYGSVKSARLVETLSRGRNGPLRWLDRCKAVIRGRLDRALGPEGHRREIVGAMLLGDREALDPGFFRIFRDSGLSHLLAISGLHVGIVIFAIVGALRRSRLGGASRFAVALLTLSALSVLVGSRPPVLRAVGSASVMLAGRGVGRDGRPLNTLAVVAAVLVLWNPWLLWAPAFQLSFAAAAGIVGLGGRLVECLPLPRFLAAAMAVSGSAYLATAPLVAWHFGRLAPAALIANLAAVPLCALVLWGGLLASLFAGIPVLGGLTVWLTRAAVDALLAVASGVSGLPGSSFAVAPPPAWLLLAYLALLVASGLTATGRAPLVPRTIARTLRLGVALCLVGLHVGPPAAGPAGAFEVSTLDVGQGQAVVLRSPGGPFLLVDAAGNPGGRFDAGERIVGPALRRMGCRRLAVLVVSHEHDDHLGGASAILRDFEVGELWLPPGSSRVPRLRELSDLARQRGAAIVLVERGGSAFRAGLELEVLHPAREDLGLPVNDRSVVLRAGASALRVMIPGDVERAGESAILAAAIDLRADALIVGHHGGRRSTNEDWLAAVAPRLAVISAGTGNRFGHPHAEVLERLARRGVRTLRTDLHGMVSLYPDRSGWSGSGVRGSEEPGDRDERGDEDRQE